MSPARVAASRRCAFESKVMKIQLIALGTLAAANLMLSGCATETTTTTSSTASQDDLTKKRTHTQEDLRKTGRSETGAALEASDASVRTTGGR